MLVSALFAVLVIASVSFSLMLEAGEARLCRPHLGTVCAAEYRSDGPMRDERGRQAALLILGHSTWASAQGDGAARLRQ
jgi:hypothetical protein